MKTKILYAMLIVLGPGVIISTPVNSLATQPNQTSAGDTQTQSNQTQTGQAQSSQTQTTPFKLSATKVELSLEQLNDVGLDLKNILTASGHLHDEVMMQPVSLITEPEMIAGTVINIPVGTQPTGPPRPARKERVDLIMSQMRPLIDLLKKNADDFMTDSQVTEYSDEMKTKVDPLFKKWLAYMDDVYARLLNLEKLTVGPTYENYAIDADCQLIARDVKQIDEVRRPIYKLIQEEGKKLSQDNPG